MMGVQRLLTASLALFPLVAYGTQIFCNDGTISGWDLNSPPEQLGTRDQVTNVVHGPPTALKFTQTFVPGSTQRYHSECRYSNGATSGQERFYGFWFRLSESWEFVDQSFNIAQFIANRKGAGCDTDDWMPSSMVWIRNNQLFSRTISGLYDKAHCGSKYRPIATYPNITTVTAGEWHQIIIQALWEDNEAGYYKIWFDGNKVLEKYNISTSLDNEPWTYEFRVGLYANGWHDDGNTMKGSQSFRQIWFDDIRIGTTFKDVDSKQTTCSA